MVRGVVAFVLASGCGAPLVQDAGESTTGGTTSTTTSSTSGTTAGIGPTTDTGESSSTSEDSGADEGLPKLDTLPPDIPPLIETCELSATEQIDLVIDTPDGPFAVQHAWWGWEACCVVDPWLFIVDGDTLEAQDGVVVTPHVEILLPGTWEHTGPYLGAMPVTIAFDIWGMADTNFDAGADLLEPLDPDAAGQPMQPDLAATIAVEGEGWSVQGSVRASYCALVDRPACPCE